MLKKCSYCNETHYESCDRIDCMEVVIERQVLEHKALAKVHEDLKRQYNREHATLILTVDSMRRRHAFGEPVSLEDILEAERILRGEDPVSKGS